MERVLQLRGALCAVLLHQAGPTFAQLAATDVNDEAQDAFGTRIGVETVGLYSETNVRGFSLQDAGNYRIEDAYFVRSAAPANPVLTGSSTRVGIGALRKDFPGPSGIVDYALRVASGGTNLFAEAGVRANSGPFAELNFDSGATDGALSVVGGLHLYPWQVYADGSTGDFFSIGAAPTWRPGPGLAVTAVATKTWWSVEADTGFAAVGEDLPRVVRPNIYRGQRWTRFRNETSVTGLMTTRESENGWTTRLALFRSEARVLQSDFNLLAVEDPAGNAQLTAFLVPENRSRSWAGEAVANRSWRAGRIEHRIIAMLRWRDSDNLVRSGTAVPLGRVNVFAAPARFDDPGRPEPGQPLRDRIVQWTFGFGYRISIGDILEVRADLQRSRYVKTVRDDGSSQRTVATPWLYSASAIVGATSALTLFGSTTRGLEESGVAPGNAVNRNAVLPPVIVEQAELGARYAITPRLSLIGAAFQVGKDIPALRADGIFDLVGKARHRGVELSVTGRISEPVSLVLGGLYLDARLGGELVELGQIGPAAVGRPDVIGFANISWRVPRADGLTVDGSLSYQGPEFVDRTNRLRTSGYASVNAGLRYQFGRPGAPLTLRARVVNILGARAWDATPAALLFFNSPRSVALSLTATV